MKVILIPVRDRVESELVMHWGFKLAKKIGSNVAGCFIRPQLESEFSLPYEANESILYPDSYDLQWEASQKTSDDEPKKVRSIFKKIAKEYDYPMKSNQDSKPYALWTKKVGSPENIFSIFGPTSDLIIVSKPIKGGFSMTNSFIFSAVLNSSAPTLILPKKKIKFLGRRICIAWNQSTQAMYAVKAALALLQKADEVNIVTSGEQDKVGPKTKHLQSYLKSWGIDSNHVSYKGMDHAKAILKGYKKNIIRLAGHGWLQSWSFETTYFWRRH